VRSLLRRIGKRLDALLTRTVCVDPYCRERGYHDHGRY
jgi:hypothetical protein